MEVSQAHIQNLPVKLDVSEELMYSEDLKDWLFFAIMIAIQVYVGYSLFSGSKRVSKRAETYDSDSLKKGSETVSQFMYILGIVIIFIIILSLISFFTR